MKTNYFQMDGLFPKTSPERCYWRIDILFPKASLFCVHKPVLVIIHNNIYLRHYAHIVT